MPSWACARFPELNARSEQEEIVVPERVNPGFAAQAGHGLVIPSRPALYRLSMRDPPTRLAERTAAASITGNDRWRPAQPLRKPTQCASTGSPRATGAVGGSRRD
jgi:2-oxoacid dehydrogenase/acyltransferase catalytic subunit